MRLARGELAMAHCQLGDEDEARKWYDQALAWRAKNPSDDELCGRMAAEAAGLIGAGK